MSVKEIKQRIIDFTDQYQGLSINHAIIRAIWEILESDWFDDHMRVEMIEELVKMTGMSELYKENLFVVVE